MVYMPIILVQRPKYIDILIIYIDIYLVGITHIINYIAWYITNYVGTLLIALAYYRGFKSFNTYYYCSLLEFLWTL